MSKVPQPASPRPPGRPRDPAKIAAILDASWRLFLARGVDAVTTDTIAAEAGVAKMTVYAYFPDKRALFQEGVRREMAKIEAAQTAPLQLVEGAGLREVLLVFGNAIMSFLSDAGAVDFYSALSGELRRDAELARLFYEAGPGRTLANLSAILSSPLASELQIDDPDAAADLLFGMWQGMSNYRLMLGVDHAGVVAGNAVRVAEGVDRFVKAFSRPGSSAPGPLRPGTSKKARAR